MHRNLRKKINKKDSILDNTHIKAGKLLSGNYIDIEI